MSEATPGLVRCPRCGAGNPADARWCGQCLERFDRPRPNRAEAAPPRPEMIREGDAFTWTCPACESTNPIDAAACARCGTSFASLFARADSKPRRSVPPGRAAVLSAALPGLGHWSLGHIGAAVARAVLYLWTLGLSLLLLVRPPATGRGIVRAIGVVFLISAAGVWLVSMIETLRLADGDEQPVLPKHALTWLSAILSMVLVLGLLGAVVSGRTAG